MSTRAREQGRGPAGAPHPASPAPAGQPVRAVGPGYKWIALSNTTLGALMATINSSIILIALPAIFNGIHLNPLAPGETNYRIARKAAVPLFRPCGWKGLRWLEPEVPPFAGL